MALAPQLPGRSDGSIEFKHQNVSDVLVELSLPYTEGYKPRSNYPSILDTEVATFLEQHPGFLQQLASARTLNPTQPKLVAKPNLELVIEEPPEKIFAPTATA